MSVLLRYSSAPLLAMSVGAGSLILETAALSIVYDSTCYLLCETKLDRVTLGTSL